MWHYGVQYIFFMYKKKVEKSVGFNNNYYLPTMQYLLLNTKVGHI